MIGDKIKWPIISKSKLIMHTDQLASANTLPYLLHVITNIAITPLRYNLIIDIYTYVSNKVST